VRRRAGHDPAPGRPPWPPRAHHREVRAGHRQRHPRPGRAHRRAAPAAGALRHPPQLAPGGVHRRRDGVLA
jgi:hypothetical protein